ncbi:GNAT family N-acetyltransferase [Microbacterium aerolatum]|uniref:GNAT family N-acetyltransferase n=1 Tax=Microbacterium aerolatum TaxID=153731 RepID=UPI00384ACF85
MEETIRIWAGDAAELAAAADLYATVFAEPPYDENPQQSRTTFLDRVERYRSSAPDFRLVLTWNDDEIVGLALGNGIAAGDWWRDRIVPQLPETAVAEWFDAECFSVIELATAPTRRRGGVGAKLLATLLDRLPYPAAVLSAYSDAEPARRFYRANGWTEVATGLRIGESPELCVYGLRLDDADAD